MEINKDELLKSEQVINEHFDRLISWSIGDIRKCAHISNTNVQKKDGAMIGAFILWLTSIEYFGGIMTGNNSVGGTKTRYQRFIKKYMPKYDPCKIYNLRTSLIHYYTVDGYVLYNDSNTSLHLSPTNDSRIFLHLGLAVIDLENAVQLYKSELNMNQYLKINFRTYFKGKNPIMPLYQIDKLVPQNNLNIYPKNRIGSVNASGTATMTNL